VVKSGGDSRTRTCLTARTTQLFLAQEDAKQLATDPLYLDLGFFFLAKKNKSDTIFLSI
jgi:hypothetical protein